jgi:hypothetical protein
MANTRDQLIASSKMDEIKAKHRKVPAATRPIKARKTSIETHETVKANTYKEAVDKSATSTHY